MRFFSLPSTNSRNRIYPTLNIPVSRKQRRKGGKTQHGEVSFVNHRVVHQYACVHTAAGEGEAGRWKAEY